MFPIARSSPTCSQEQGEGESRCQAHGVAFPIIIRRSSPYAPRRRSYDSASSSWRSYSACSDGSNLFEAEGHRLGLTPDHVASLLALAGPSPSRLSPPSRAPSDRVAQLGTGYGADEASMEGAALQAITDHWEEDWWNTGAEHPQQRHLWRATIFKG